VVVIISTGGGHHSSGSCCGCGDHCLGDGGGVVLVHGADGHGRSQHFRDLHYIQQNCFSSSP